MSTSTPSYSDLYAQVAAIQASVATEFKAVLDAALPQLATLADQLDETAKPVSALKSQLDAVVGTLTSYSAAVGYYIPADPSE
jgi:NAD(P)H-dependent FMN reductase